MLKKISSIIAVSLLVLAGCSSNGGTQEAANTFTVGMECNYAPSNWTQAASNEYAVRIGEQYCDGFDVQVAKILAEDMGKELVVKKIEWDALIPAVNAGEIDAIIAGMSPTAERAQAIDFSEVYYRSKFGIVVRKDGNFAAATTINDFAGAKVTAQLGTHHVSFLEQLVDASKVAPMSDFAAMILALNANEIDAYVADEDAGLSAVNNNPGLMYINLTDVPGGYKIVADQVGVAIGLKKGNQELLEAVNKGIVTKLPAGTADKLMSEARERQVNRIED
jgi:ABC-type amino acid transport/signal transduction systems, periplasmic component/domain